MTVYNIFPSCFSLNCCGIKGNLQYLQPFDKINYIAAFKPFLRIHPNIFSTLHCKIGKKNSICCKVHGLYLIITYKFSEQINIKHFIRISLKKAVVT